ncbi:MAG: hypothetical protein P4M13_00910 [Alphaproteobacteria bacterium]|nr:hypothetical protein [Alphaproteobacteria bacterium]
MSIQGMKITKSSLLAASMALLLALAPAFAANSATPDDSLTQTVSEAPPPAAPTSIDPSLAMASSSDGTDSLANFGPSSGTVVGNRAAALRDEVLRLRSSVNLNSNEFAILRTSGAAGAVQYHSTVAAITARLQNGTTKGNPILLRQWEEADASLGEVTSSLNKLNSLQVSVDADASVASYLLDSVQAAFDLSGAVDEDHDQLKLLHDEVSRLVVQLDYLRNQTTADIERQSTYLTTERGNLQALAFAISRGELLGNSLANRPVIVNSAPVVSLPPVNSSYAPRAAPAVPVTQSSLGPAPMSPRDLMQESGERAMPVASSIATSNPNVGVAPSVGRLLVLIRYNQPHVDYEQQLSQAVGAAIERRPNAEFSIVAVSPASGDPAALAEQQQTAKNDADDVKRSLIQLGLSPSRITLANTQADTAQTPEVHVYIR